MQINICMFSRNQCLKKQRFSTNRGSQHRSSTWTKTGGRCQESSASASAIGPAAAASATALTHGADVLRQRARAEDAVPATADNEAKPTAAATTAATTAARTEATTTAARTEATTEATTK